MRIAAMAAGAVGGYFGARLAAAGHDVFFIARGANLAAIETSGLNIESVHGDLHLPKVNVTDDPKAIGPVDIVLFAVKLWDTEKAAELTKPMMTDTTRVITLQNGIDSAERLAYHKRPGYVAFIDDLPLSSTQKPQRGEIKAMAADMVRRGVAIDLREMKAGIRRKTGHG